MHILVVNDDGPPSSQSSPYIHAFVQALQKAGHLVSVVLPHEQRSWIGKAHFVGQLTKPTYFHPGSLHQDNGTVHSRPLHSDEVGEEWILVDGTPATCTQLGLHHFFQDRPPVDLVISGPNYGRNSTSLFSLSSGTIGGALEAAVCRKRAIALSFAFYSRDHDASLIDEGVRHSIKLIDYLATNWDESVDLYSCNVPLIKGVGNNKTMLTHALQNYWTSGSSFEEVEATEDGTEPSTHEQEIREADISTGTNARGEQARHRHRNFKWAPRFGDVQKSIEGSSPGNDGWALHQGFTSVTPLKANYMHASTIPLGELKLSHFEDPGPTPVFHAIIDADPYVLPLINEALSKTFLSDSYKIIKSPDQMSDLKSPVLQIRPYESIDFSHVLENPKTSFVNSYAFRKALIRKHYLHNTVSSWWSKHSNDANLRGHVPLTVAFEIDFAEFLDEALAECFELYQSFAAEEREWWVLKPGMSDQGQGVRLFSSEDELRAIFQEYEAEEFVGDEEDEPETPPATNGQEVIGASTMTSQLRHFIAQRYIEAPLLFKEHGYRKFHIRCYVLAVGAICTYVYEEMLALFALQDYRSPAMRESGTRFGSRDSLDPRIHLTNTCLQDGSREGSVVPFKDLPESTMFLNSGWKDSVLDQICAATGTLFEAAAREQMIHFQTLENAFEVFGVDWMVDEKGAVWLLEVNAFPDFKQSGEDLKGLMQGLWDGVVGVAVKGFLAPNGLRLKGGDVAYGMRKVLDIDLGRH